AAGRAMKRLLIALIGLAVVGGGFYWYRGQDHGAPAQAARPAGDSGPAPVVTGLAERKPMPFILTSVGRVETINSAAVRSRVEGEVLTVHFAEGQDVKADDLLFTLDTRASDIALQQAEAALARDEAQLASAKADVKRYSELARSGYATPQKQEQTTASAGVLEAAIKADTAAIDRAKLDREWAK